MQHFFDSMLELITQTSSNLPTDVRAAMRQARAMEDAESQSGQALAVIATNIDMAHEQSGAICQDTGWPTFEFKVPRHVDQRALLSDIRRAVAEATRMGKLRPNSVDSLTGKNSGNNLGPGMPTVHFEQTEQDHHIEVQLLLKGGGCENKNIQYSLPCELPHLGRADRDLDGARKCLLHAVWQAQGQGCSQGALGACIGGDRANSYEHAKRQLFRSLEDRNPNPSLAQLEQYIMTMANTLGIGTMGFGGQATLIGCKVGLLNRLPASFFVSVAYNCWAFRRLGVVLSAHDGRIFHWLHRNSEKPPEPMSHGEGFPRSGREIVLRAPLTEEQVRQLKVGDLVLLHGRMVTGRDAVHHHLMHHQPPVDLQGGVLYHCGPVVLMQDDEWVINAAGPTTSIREEPYEADVIRRYGLRAVVGKGGMGARTLAAMKECGAIYLNAIGGAAQYYARCIQKVLSVHLLEFGIPEAMWEIEVNDFPAVVTMDAHGNSLHAEVEKSSAAALAHLADPVFS